MYNLKRRTQILLSSIPISILLLFLVSFHTTTPKTPQSSKPLHIHQHSRVAHSFCDGTLHHDLCVSTLLSIPNLSSKSLHQIISSTINTTVLAVRRSESNCSGIRHNLPKPNTIEARALDDCIELLDETLDQLYVCMADLSSPTNISKHAADLLTLLSAAITNQYTCLDGFSHGDRKKIRRLIEERLYNISHLVSNSLALLKKVQKAKGGFSEGYGKVGREGFPSWLSRRDRQLLQANANQTRFDLVVAKDGSGNYTTIGDAVAAAPNGTKGRFVIYVKAGAYLENVDVGKKKTNLMFIGDGIQKTVVKASRNVVDNYTTFRSATFVKGSGSHRFLMNGLEFTHGKFTCFPGAHAGFGQLLGHCGRVYGSNTEGVSNKFRKHHTRPGNENSVSKFETPGANLAHTNVQKKPVAVAPEFMQTFVKAQLSNPFYVRWLLSVVGNGFLARDMSFENTAGPSKHQAVALRSGSDLSAFYRCSFAGYQDTLYVHSLRQFYRECDVYGTIDFIFGNAAVVFQNCNLYARKPNPSQKNIFTAQGREDPNQNTGISIQNCKVTAAADLLQANSTFKTYLGRPWKKYSRTVYLQSFIDSVVDPAGWLEWSGDFGLSTLYYGEYMNRGPGANTTNRVKWPGYRVINSSAEASQFTVEPFIQGSQWLSSAQIPFDSGLI
ncbi:hypothetical protein ACLOJK_026274 [Asimina triloba]